MSLHCADCVYASFAFHEEAGLYQGSCSRGYTLANPHAEKSDLAVYEAVRGMLPKNSLGRDMIKKLRVYKGAEHNHAAQKPEELKLF